METRSSIVQFLCLSGLSILLGEICANDEAVKHSNSAPDLDKLLRHGFDTINVDGDVIVLLGISGGGKSTLSKFIRRDATLKVAEKKIDFIFVDGESKIGSESLTSKTLEPNVDMDPETGIFMVDCAGFEDTRSPDHDLLVGFFNKRVLEASKRVKIIIVENFSNVKSHESRSAFPKTLKHIGNLLKSNINSFNGSIGLIATKVETPASDDKVINVISDFLNDTLTHFQKSRENAHQNNLTTQVEALDREILILKSLLQEKRVAIFRRPSKLGNPWESESLKANFLLIRQVVFDEIHFSSLFGAKFHITVDPKTVIHIKDVIFMQTNKIEYEIFSSLYEFMKQKFTEFTKAIVTPWNDNIDRNIEFCQNYDYTLNMVVSLSQLESFLQSRGFAEEKLLNDLRFLILKRIFLYDAVGKTQVEAENLNEFHRHKTNLLSFVNATLEFYTFFSKVHKFTFSYRFQHSLFENSTNVKNFFRNVDSYDLDDKSLTKIALNLDLSDRFITEFARATFKIHETTVHNYVLTIRGQFILLSKVVSQITDQQFDEVVLVASKKIFIDHDLKMQHTNLVMAAPVIEVMGPMKTIYLHGENGNDHGKVEKATGKNIGKSGEKGRDAFSSGYFYLYALKIVNSQFLTIKMEGGNGGNGQDGGDGSDAEPRPQATITDSVIERGSNRQFLFIPSSPYYTVRQGPLEEIGIGFTINKIAITVTGDDGFAPPTKGGNGGRAGAEAAPGNLMINVRDEVDNLYINSVFVAPHPGQPGKAGRAGSTSSRGYKSSYDCYSHASSSGFETYGCKIQTSEKLPNYNNAINGQDGEPAAGPILQRYKKKMNDTTIFTLVLHYIQLSYEKNIESEFITYLLQKDSDFNLKDYLKFLIESNKLITHVDTIENRGYLTNLKAVSLLVAEKFRNHTKLCSNCNAAFISLIDYIFFEHLNTIETIFDGKQICNLAAIVDKYLNYNSDTANDLITNGQFQLVESEKKAFIHEIEASGVLINILYEQEMTEMDKSLDHNLNELVAKSINMRQVNSNNVDKLNRMHAEVNSAMKAKVAFGVINTIGLISSILFPPAAILTQTVTGVAGSAMSTDANYQKHQSLVAEGMQNAKKLLARFSKKTEIEQSTVTSALKNLTDFEKEGEQFLSEKTRKNAVAILKEPKKIFTINTAILLRSLNDEVKARIDNLAQYNGSDVNIKRLEKLRTGLKVAVHMAGASIEVVNTVKSFLHDQSALSQIEATILANQVALKDLAEYEKVIKTTFEPVLQEMIATFERKKLDIKNSNDFEREFQKLNLKKYARECISLVNKVTEGFDDDNSFAGIITDLQDFMTTVIDIYDKISEYEHRARLSNFIGQMNGGKCSEYMSNDPEACNLFLSASAEIDGTKLNKNFVHIFRAHQQVMCPYGGEQMHLLSSSISTLLQEPLMKLPDKIKLLHKALTTIKDQLTEDDHTIMKDKDRFIFFAQFNSYFKSRSPFYVWLGSKFGAQIKKLLSGEQVNFAASVLQPRTENAVKFKTIMLNVTSRNPTNVAIVQDLLRNFNVEMMHGGESYYKCGTRFYSIPGERQLIEMSFERDNRGDLVSVNRVYEKLKYGDVPMSPYTSWRFQLKCVSKEKPCLSLFNELSSLAHEVDLELVGSGYFLKEDAPICETDLARIYTSFAMSIL